MRLSTAALAILAATACTAPHAARAQNPQQLLQGLLSGNQGQDQAVRDAFERGYRAGRDDQRRDDQARLDRRPPPPPPRGAYPDQDYQRDPYRR